MIIDKLTNAPFYYGLNIKIKKSLEYLNNTDLITLENGRYEIEGDDIFVIIQDYKTKLLSEGRFEAHRKYIDIQYIIEGRESMGYVNLDKFNPETEYDFEKDIVFGKGEGIFLLANKGDFIVFAPQDAHMPGISVQESEYVKKAVIKIKV